MQSNLAHNRKFLSGLIVISALLLVAGGAALWTVTRRPAAPAPVVKPTLAVAPDFLLTPVASLDELADRYPQIAGLLRDESLGSVYKDFVLAYQTGGIDAARALAEQRGLLDKKEQMRITLMIDDEANTAAVAGELGRMGIVIEGTYRDLIDIAVPLALIEQFSQADNASQLFEQLTQLQHIIKLRLPLPTQVNTWPLEEEGPQVTGAAAWHAAGYTGQGVKVGILDLGFDGYKKLLGSALPAQVEAKSFVLDTEPDATGEVHGAACAEIVHAMAPDAQLYLAYYGGTETGLGNAVDWLLSQGVQVISHSAGSSLGPMDGSGRQAALVDEVVSKGVVWVNASGNEAMEHYRGVFSDANGDGVHEFPDGTDLMAYRPPSQGDATVILNWDDWTERNQDFDLYLYDQKNNLVVSSRDSQTGQPGDIPAEGFRLTTLADDVYYLVIKSDHATRPVTFDLYALNGSIEFPTPDHSLSTPGDARAALTVGAIDWNSGSLEDFSSQGPTNDGRIKPDLVAPDRVTTTSYAPDSFPGTSASTPHVAGAVALLLSAFPADTPDDVRAYFTAHARDLGPAGPDTEYGFGALALPAVSAAAASPVATVPVVTTPTVPLETATDLPAPETATPLVVAPQAGTPVIRQPNPVAPQPTNNATLLILVGLGAVTCLGMGGLLGGIVFLVIALRKGPQPAPAPRPVAQPLDASPRALEEPQRLPGTPQAASDITTPSVATAYLANSAGVRVALHLGDNHVGRVEENEIVLADDIQVSRRHALIAWDGRRCTVSDLESSNGTYLNGRRLAPHAPQPLANGDRVRFGPRNEWTVSLPAAR